MHALAEALVALLGQNREVKMPLEVGRLLLQIFEFFIQIASHHAGNFALGLRPLVKPTLRNFLIRRLLQETFSELVKPAPRDSQILTGLRRRDLLAHEVREDLPSRLPAQSLVELRLACPPGSARYASQFHGTAFCHNLPL